MSTTIDERVVSMQFDNKNFEKNVQTSMSTIEKLKHALKFDGASKGLDHLSAQAKKCDLTPLANSADKVSLRFSAMYTAADQVFRNLVNSAEHAAKRIVSAFTIDPVRTGFSEYETQINAVQTILANTQSKGSTLDDVNAALDELNKYADKTIYNFTEMTRNIGTFTAAGVDLDKSVSSIKGIANLAAVSGSSSQQASTAMYQLSQALAAGKVQLMDWNSVVNAGMGGQLFQDALKRTATHMGKNVDEMIKKYGSFRESLTQGEWLTAEVLTETLTQLSGAYSEADLIAKGYTEEQAKEIAELAETAVNAATKVKTFTQLMDTLKEAAQSGWTQTWELIIGDFEEAKELWTAVSDKIGGFINNMSESRNKVLGGALESNYDKLITKLNDAGIATDIFEDKVTKVAKDNGLKVEYLVKKYGSLEGAIRKGAISSEILQKAVDGLSKSSANLSIVDDILKFGAEGDAVKEVQQALVDLGHDVGKTGVDGILGANTTAAIKAFQELKGLEVTGIIDEKTLDALKEATAGAKNLSNSVKNLIDNVTTLGGREKLIEAFGRAFRDIGRIFDSIGSAFWMTFEPITEYDISNLIDGFNELTKKLSPSTETIEKLRTTFRGLFSIIKVITSIVGGAFSTSMKLAGKVLGNFDLGILDVTASVGKALTKFEEWFRGNDILGKGIEFAANKISSGITKIREWFNTFKQLPWVQNGIKRFKDGFSDAFGKVGEFCSGAYERIRGFFKYLGDLLKGNKSIDLSSIWTYLKENVFGYFTNFDYSGIFEKVVSAFKQFKTDVGKYLEGAGETFTTVKTKVVDFFKALKQAIGDNMGSIIVLGVIGGFLLLLKGIKNAIETIAHPLEGFSDIAEGFNGVLKGMQKALGGLAFNLKAQGIKAIAESIAILAGAVAVLAFIPAPQLWGAVGAITAISVVIGALVFVLGKVESLPDMAKLSITLLGLSGALMVLALSLKIIGGLDNESLGKGILAVGAFLGICWAMTEMSKSLKSGVSFTGFGKMVTQLSTSLILVAVAAKIFGTMEWEELKKGGVAFGAFILAMIGLMEYSDKLGPRLPAFGSMIKSLSTSLLLTAVAIKIIGGMEWEDLGKGGAAFVVFMGTMVGMMAATKLLAKDIPSFGMTMTGLSAGLLAMAITVKILAGISNNDLTKGGLVITGFLGLMVGMMAATKLLGEYSSNAGKVGLMMLAFSGSILILTGAIALLAMIDAKDIWKAIGAISAVSVLFGALIYVSGQTKSGKNTANVIMKLSIAVGVLALSLAALSFVNTNKLLGATAALTIIIGAFSLLTYSTKFAGKKVMATLITLTACVGVLAGVIAGLAMLTDANDAIKIATGLSVLILSLSGSIALLSKMGHIDTKSLFTAIGAVGALLAVVGLVVGAFAAAAIAALPAIGTKLSEFTKNAKPFFDTAKDIKEDNLKGVKMLAETVGILAGASFKSALTDIIPGGSLVKSLGAFKEWIKGVIPIITQMAKDLSAEDVKIDSQKLDAVIRALKTICEAASLAPTSKAAGGLISTGKLIAGGGYIEIQHLDAFAEWVKAVCPAVTDMAVTLSTTGDLDVKGITDVMDSVLTLAEAADKGPSFKGAAGFAKIGPMIAFGGAWEWPKIEAFANWITTVSDTIGNLATTLKTQNLTEVDYTGIAKIMSSVESYGLAISYLQSDEIKAIIGGAGGPWGGAGFAAGSWSFPDLSGFESWIKTATEELEGLGKVCKEINLDAGDYDGISSLLSAVESLGKAISHTPSLTIGAGIGAGQGSFLSKLKGLIAGGVEWPLIGRFAEWVKSVLPAMKELAVALDEADIDPKVYDGIDKICTAIVTLSGAFNSLPSLTVAGGWLKVGPFNGAGGTVIIPQLYGFTNFIAKAMPAMKDLAVECKNAKLETKDYSNVKSICTALATVMNAGSNLPSIKVGVGGAWGKGFGGLLTSFEWTNFDVLIELIRTAGPELAKLGESLKNDYKLTDTDYSNLTKICTNIATLAEAAGNIPTFDIAAFGAGGFWGGGGGGRVSWALFDEFIQFIKDVQQPMVELANAVKFNSSDGSKWDFSGVTVICKGVAALGEAMVHVPKTTLALAAGGGVFGGKKIWGVLPYADIPLVDQFARWITAVVPAMQNLVTALADKNLLDGKHDFSGITVICEAVAALAVAMDHVPKFDVDLGGGKFGAFGGGLGAYMGVDVPLIDQFAQWITDVLDAMKLLVIALDGAELLDGKHDFSGITVICEGLAALGTAVGGNVPSVDVTTILAGGKWGAAIGNRTEVPLISQFAEWIKSASGALKDVAVALGEKGLMDSDTDWSGITAICDGLAALSAALGTEVPGTEVSVGAAAIGPVAAFWVGVKVPDLKGFGEWIAAVGPTVSQFAIDIAEASSAVEGGLDFTPVKTVCNAVKMLAEAAKAVPADETLDVLGLWSSRKTVDLTGFTEWLVGDGTESNPGVINALKSFADNVGTITFNESAVIAAATAGKMLGEMSSMIPKEKEGGWGIFDIFGKDTVQWDTFNTNIGKFAEAIVGFSTTLTDGKISETAVTAAATAGKILAETGTIMSDWWIESDVTYLETIKTAVIGIAECLVEFAGKVATIDVEATSTAATAAKNISQALSNLKDYNYESFDSAGFNKVLGQIADAMKKFADDLAGISISAPIKDTTDLANLISGMSTMNFNGASAFQKAMEDLGKTGIKEFIAKFTDSKKAVEDAANTLVDNATAAMKSEDNYEDFKDAGKYLVEGLAEGIKNNSSLAEKAAAAVVDAAETAAREAGLIESPSKVWYELGFWTVKGYANALHDGLETAYSSGYDVSEAAKNGLNSAISKMRDIVENDIGNAQPTIRPVLDLSDVSAGVDGMNRMFDMRPSVGVMSNVRAIGSMINSRRQNGSNRDVVSAIEDLGQKMGNARGDTYNFGNITYDDDSRLNNAVQTLVRAAKVERRK